jgi:hypothetical protein
MGSDMGISTTGSNRWSMSSFKTTLTVVLLLLGLGIYLYGPPFTPRLHAAAVRACNDHAGGNYRSYRLSWHVGVGPHWTCWDASRPSEQPVDMGWWVGPLQ